MTRTQQQNALNNAKFDLLRHMGKTTEFVKAPPNVILAVRRAYAAAKRCQEACAEADAAVGTYWTRDGVSTTKNTWLSRDMRDAADLTVSMAHHLRMKTVSRDPA